MLNYRSSFCALAAVLTAALAGCDGKGERAAQESEQSERPVLVAPVRYAAQSQAREFVATIRPRVESDQGFRIAGKVVSALSKLVSG